MTAPPSPRILIVDDEPMNLFNLEALLRHFGFAVTAAINSTEALALILRDPFELFLIDLHLPGMSGVEVARRAQEHQPAAGILIMAGSDAFGVTPHSHSTAPFACLPKTASPHEMISRVAQATPQCVAIAS